MGQQQSTLANAAQRQPNQQSDLANVHPARQHLLTSSAASGQQQASTQPPPAGGLFGNTQSNTNQQPNQNTSSLFSGNTQQQPSQNTSSLFGSNNQNQQANPNNTTSLFGSNTQQQPNQNTTSLFGNSTQQQPTQNTTSLFGNTAQQQPNQNSTSLFGSNPQQQPNQNTTSLFGGNTQQQPNQNTTSLFGSTSQQQPAQNTTSLFGSNAQQQPTTSLFGNTMQQQQQQQQQPSSIFGLSAQPPGGQQQASLLGASQYRNSQYQSFAGKLTMGQPSSTTQAAAQGAVKVHENDLKSTTRFTDLIDDVKTGLENVDRMIQAQERFCREIEAFLPKHGENVQSLAPDVELVKEKAESVEYAMGVDAQGVETARKNLNTDQMDFDRCQRVIDNMRQPYQYQYSGYGSTAAHRAISEDFETRDMDLIGNYFVPLTGQLQQTLNAYSSNLTEIEGHMRVIESSAMAQAHQLAAKRNGVSGQTSGEDTVRELADTLRGFEASILGAAGLVGQCREGVHELVLGKLGVGGRL